MINSSYFELKNETICALSTPAGAGAIAVIRLSGNNAIEICEKVFKSPLNKKLIEQKPNTIHFGTLMNDTESIDEVLVALFRAPHSYTGENVVEISCHGSQYIQQQILTLLSKSGARQAKPGEFTMRAFMNGKMDLSQAEAVADLITSNSESSKQIALHQLRGGFSKEINYLRSELLTFITLIELELDFSEEDVEFADRSKLIELIEIILKLIHRLTESFSLGNAIKNGIPVAIVGEPNVGKSTLLNVLLNEEKAIVTEIAGTTRDAIEDTVNINGIQFRFIDTAGIRETSDKIEKIGIEKTYKKIEEARIVLILCDAKKFNEKEMQKIEQLIENHRVGERQFILVLNKIDEVLEGNEAIEIQDTLKIPLLRISAKNQENIDKLTEELLKTVDLSRLNNNESIVTNARHHEALLHAGEALTRAHEGLHMHLPSDLLSQDIREALHYLSSITGEISTDEVLINIFKNFCIGK